MKPFNEPESQGHPRPEVGDEDVVVGEKRALGKMYYKLERFEDKYNYKSDHFAILPDEPAEVIEETEMMEA